MLIYATSNRRHLLPEYFSENLETKHVGDEVHPGESVEEKISLSERFGLWISFYPFSQDDYLAAVARWLAAFGVAAPKSARDAEARTARRCSSRCSAARAAAASRGSSRRATPAPHALRKQAGAERERRARPRRRAVILRAGRPRAARAAPAGQGLRRLLGISRRQARARRDAARTRSPASCTRSSASPCAAPRRGSSQRYRLSARARRAPFLSRVRVGRRAASATTARRSRGRRPGDFDVAPLLPANTLVLRALSLPPVYGITHGRGPRRGRVSRARRGARSPRGLRLIQLREKDWPLARQRALAERCSRSRAPRGAKVLLNGDADDARAWGCDGVHWTAAALAAATARPRRRDAVRGVVPHARGDRARGALGARFRGARPGAADADASRAPALGWDGFAAHRGATRRCRSSRWAGSTRGDLDVAIAHGAHGVALRRGAWT